MKRISLVSYILISTRNTAENSPNLGMSIIWSMSPPRGDEIRGHSTSHTGNHSWELTQPRCEYPLNWSITSWWWNQGSLYIPHRGTNTPENSPNLGVSILSIEPPPHGDEIRGHSTPHTGLVPLPGTHPTLVWVSSQVCHHLLVMRSVVTPIQVLSFCPSTLDWYQFYTLMGWGCGLQKHCPMFPPWLGIKPRLFA